MNPAALIESLASFPPRLAAAIAGLGPEEARWRPSDDAWSIVEIVRHLGDEEVDDFRTRTRLTLTEPDTAWPGIDPEGWARDRNYRDDDLAGALARFTHERGVSIEWLGGLVAADWERTHQHPRIGALRAGDLLVSWAAHDWLHLRQITKRGFQRITRDAGNYQTSYAGTW